MRALTSDQLGTAGERTFYGLCDATLHCQKVSEDKTGWDYYVEWPNALAKEPYDLQPTPLSCHVQVKAKWLDSEWIQAPLSSIARLASEPKPAFLYVLSYNSIKRPVSCRIIPVRGNFLGEILRQQRKAFIEKKKPNTPFRFTPSKWGTEIGLETDSFKAFVEGHVGTDVSAYISEKQFEYDNLGYEEGRVIIRGHLSVTDRQELRNAYLDGSDLRAEILSAADRRFGLETDATQISVGPSILRFSERGGTKSTLRIWPGQLESPVSFEGKWHVLPHGIAAPGFSEGVFQSEIVTVLGKARFSDAPENFSCELTLQIDGSRVLNAKLKPSKWADFYRFISKSVNNDIKIRLETKGKPSIEGQLIINQPPDSKHFYQRMENLTRVLHRACELAGCPNVTLGLNDFYVQGPSILHLGKFMEAPSAYNANFGSELCDVIKGGEVLPLLYFGTVQLRNFALSYCVEMEFTSSLSHNETTWKSTKIALLEIIRTSIPTSEILDVEAVSFLDRMRLTTGIDSYYIDDITLPEKSI